MIAIFYLVLQILKLYSYVVIANVVISSVSKNLARAAESLPSPNLLRGCAFAIPSAIAVFFNCKRNRQSFNSSFC